MFALTRDMIPMIVDAYAPVLPNETMTDEQFVDEIAQCGGVYFDHLVFLWNGLTFVVVKAMTEDHHNSPFFYSTFIHLDDGWDLIETLTSWVRTKYFGRLGFDQGDYLKCSEYDEFIATYRDSKYDRMGLARVMFAKNDNVVTRLPKELQVLIEKFVVPLTNTSFLELHHQKTITRLVSLSL